MGEKLLRMSKVSKSFAGQPALRSVDFEVSSGEIHALIGENGAGKTTLMNILGGVVHPDEGLIALEGEPVHIPSPAAAQRLGVSFVHQELNLINDLRVYENFFLGAEARTRTGFLDTRAMCERTGEILALLGVQIDPREYVGKLDSSYKQVVEIGRAVHQRAKILILDEPTTSLTDREIRFLFAVMRSLRERGVAVIFISHKLKEVLAICDSYTVLRDGRVAATGRVAESGLREEELARMMVGREMADQQFWKPRELGGPVLSVENLSSEGCVQGVSFTLRQREVLGFTGLIGDGRTELFECVFGHRRYQGGVRIDGQLRHLAHPAHALAAGIGLAPKNRKENALIRDFSVRANTTIARLGALLRGPFIDQRREKARARRHVADLNIKVGDVDVSITALSGGNQQKVVLAKWIEARSRIMILDNPTQGIDVGAKAEIYGLIMRLAAEGKSIVVLSSEVPELLKVCDRVAIMFHGRLLTILERSAATEERVMLYATGARGQGEAGSEENRQC